MPTAQAVMLVFGHGMRNTVTMALRSAYESKEHSWSKQRKEPSLRLASVNQIPNLTGPIPVWTTVYNIVEMLFFEMSNDIIGK